MQIIQTLFIMYRFNKDGISVLVVVDRRRKKNNGLYPVKIEVIYRRVQKYFPTGKDVSLEEWENLWTSRKLSRKCTSIENSFHLVRNAVERLAEKGQFTFQRLEVILGRGSGTVNMIMQQRMKELMNQGRINSYYRFRSTLNALEKFAGKNIQLENVTPMWLRRCDMHWRKEGKNDTTINIYMKTLQNVYKTAIGEGLVREALYPFGKDAYRIPSGSGRKMALDKGHIEAVNAWKGDEETEYWRDLWMFSYLCNGINFRDMLFLRYMNIYDDEITFVRSKTKGTRQNAVTIRAPLTRQMKDIMQRSGNGETGESEKFIFRHAKGNETPMQVVALVRKAIAQCNAALKIIARDIGIAPFSTYAARHSFATVLKRSGADITFISESLGHSSITTTECYLAGYDKEDRKAFAAKLL